MDGWLTYSLLSYFAEISFAKLAGLQLLNVVVVEQCAVNLYMTTLKKKKKELAKKSRREKSPTLTGLGFNLLEAKIRHLIDIALHVYSVSN